MTPSGVPGDVYADSEIRNNAVNQPRDIDPDDVRILLRFLVKRGKLEKVERQLVILTFAIEGDVMRITRMARLAGTIGRTLPIVLGLALALPGIAGADTFVDDFEGGTNEAGWAFIRGFDVIESSGGNPGSYLHQPTYDTFAPILESLPGSGTPFEGDYVANGVSRISWDAITQDMNFPDGEGFSITLLLRDRKGTADVEDDDYVYFVGPNVPRVGQGWVHYDVAIPSEETDLPAGWKGGWVGDCENLRPGVTWQDVISNVEQVEIWWIDPCFFAIFQQWNVGVDNLEIEFGGATPIVNSTWGRIKATYDQK
jgi:hypothetical protein